MKTYPVRYLSIQEAKKGILNVQDNYRIKVKENQIKLLRGGGHLENLMILLSRLLLMGKLNQNQRCSKV